MSFSYAFQDIPDDETVALLVNPPSRWGRMGPLSRAVIVEIGRSLAAANMLDQGSGTLSTGLTAGLIGATRQGSLSTDLDFTATLAKGVRRASPALFSSTLANIPLAEAASHFGLTGPVYALFAGVYPLAEARAEAKSWLLNQPLSFMLACEFDCLVTKDTSLKLILTCEVVRFVNSMS